MSDHLPPYPMTAGELDQLERRTIREPVFSTFADCSLAIADRRALLCHIRYLEERGRLALAIAAGQDAAAESPDPDAEADL